MDKQQLDNLISELSKRPPCKIGKWLEKQDTKFQANFQKATTDQDINNYTVWRACIKMGLDSSNSTFYRHVKQECSCYSQL